MSDPGLTIADGWKSCTRCGRTEERLWYHQGVDGLCDKCHVGEDATRQEDQKKPAETGDRMKLDHGKAPWHLAPWDAFLCIVKVLAFGAAKYRERGWEEGMQWSRCYSACMRHMTDWFMRNDKGKGPGKDADTGYSDLWHAGCCVCFLIAYELRAIGTDDRPAR